MPEDNRPLCLNCRAAWYFCKWCIPERLDYEVFRCGSKECSHIDWKRVPIENLPPRYKGNRSLRTKCDFHPEGKTGVGSAHWHATNNDSSASDGETSGTGQYMKYGGAPLTGVGTGGSRFDTGQGQHGGGGDNSGASGSGGGSSGGSTRSAGGTSAGDAWTSGDSRGQQGRDTSGNTGQQGQGGSTGTGQQRQRAKFYINSSSSGTSGGS